MTLSSSAVSVIYPDSDGLPMSDNTEQFRWIVMIKENLEILFALTLDVFVAGDLLWYPIEGDNKTRIAPDVMVAFGRPKGKRGSYMQWKEQGIAPQVAFEILSPSNTGPEMATKRSFYERHGVEEYYVYDPDRLRLSGFTRQGGQLIAIASMEGWVSPLLGIRFTRQNGDLEIYRADGRRFLSSVELDRRAEQALDQAEVAQAQAQAAQTQAESERALRLAAEARMAEMIEQMRQLGLDPEQV
jgi:Uma2 family endonuclease